MSCFFIMTLGSLLMQNIEEIYEIDLSNCEDSQKLVDEVIEKLENATVRNAYVKLKLGNIQINQSQMVFIKSLVEGFGHILAYVDTENDSTREVCIETEISTEGHQGFASISAQEVQNSTLDDLREEFKTGFGNEEEPAKEEVHEEYKPENEPIENEENETTKIVEVIKNNEPEIQKQVIGVYRKADEKENEAEFQDEEVDFYATATNEEVVADTNKTI